MAIVVLYCLYRVSHRPSVGGGGGWGKTTLLGGDKEFCGEGTKHFMGDWLTQYG